MNRCYTKDILSKHYCLIDTSSLMNDSMSLFIEKNRGFMLSNNIRIAIHVVNIKELQKHAKSNDPYKFARAEKALEIIETNMDLFEHVGKLYEGKEINSTFADPMVLSTLMINKPHYSQCLISNDEGLTTDAYDFLNNLNSINGKPIFVCRIGRDGDLVKCRCVDEINNKVGSSESVVEVPVEKIVEKVIEKPVYIEKVVEKPVYIKKKINIFDIILASGSIGAGIGYLYSKNETAIRRGINNIGKAIAAAF